MTQSLISQRKFAEAEGFARESLAIREGSTPDDWRTFNSRSLLGLGRFGEAEPLLLSAYEGMKQQEHRIPAAGKPQISETLQRLVQLHETTDRSAKAAEWSLKLAELHPPLPPRFWGFYDYPLVDGDNLICAPGGAGATVVALNKRTGELAWKTGVPGGEPGTHGSAVLSTAGGIRHTVVFLNSGPMGIAADDGRVLWRYERGAGRSVSYTPVIRDDLVFAPSGYGWGMALLKVELASPAYSYKLALHRLRPTSSAKPSGSIHGAPAGGSSESP